MYTRVRHKSSPYCTYCHMYNIASSLLNITFWGKFYLMALYSLIIVKLWKLCSIVLLITFSTVVNILALCKRAYLISSARSEVMFVHILPSCHQAFLAVVSQSLLWGQGDYSNCLDKSRLFNLWQCERKNLLSATSPAHHHTMSNHLFIMPPHHQCDSQNTTGMLWEFPLILLETNWNSQFISTRDYFTK